MFAKRHKRMREPSLQHGYCGGLPEECHQYFLASFASKTQFQTWSAVALGGCYGLLGTLRYMSGSGVRKLLQKVQELILK